MEHRQLITGLLAAPPIIIDGVEYAGSFFARLVAIDPELTDSEAMETSQIIAELGHLVARAYAAKQRRELEYRIWRDSTVYGVTNSVPAALSAGFECAGKSKLPSHAAAEAWTRTLPEYIRHHEAIIRADEAWQTVNIALDAAKARSWAIRGFNASGGESSYGRPVSDYPKRVEALPVDAAEDAAYPATLPPPPPPPPPRKS